MIKKIFKNSLYLVLLIPIVLGVVFVPKTTNSELKKTSINTSINQSNISQRSVNDDLVDSKIISLDLKRDFNDNDQIEYFAEYEVEILSINHYVYYNIELTENTIDKDNNLEYVKHDNINSTGQYLIPLLGLIDQKEYVFSLKINNFAHKEMIFIFEDNSEQNSYSQLNNQEISSTLTPSQVWHVFDPASHNGCYAYIPIGAGWYCYFNFKKNDGEGRLQAKIFNVTDNYLVADWYNIPIIQDDFGGIRPDMHAFYSPRWLSQAKQYYTEIRVDEQSPGFSGYATTTPVVSNPLSVNVSNITPTQATISGQVHFGSNSQQTLIWYRLNGGVNGEWLIAPNQPSWPGDDAIVNYSFQLTNLLSDRDYLIEIAFGGGTTIGRNFTTHQSPTPEAIYVGGVSFDNIKLTSVTLKARIISDRTTAVEFSMNGLPWTFFDNVNAGETIIEFQFPEKSLARSTQYYFRVRIPVIHPLGTEEGIGQNYFKTKSEPIIGLSIVGIDSMSQPSPYVNVYFTYDLVVIDGDENEAFYLQVYFSNRDNSATSGFFYEHGKEGLNSTGIYNLFPGTNYQIFVRQIYSGGAIGASSQTYAFKTGGNNTDVKDTTIINLNETFVYPTTAFFRYEYEYGNWSSNFTYSLFLRSNNTRVREENVPKPSGLGLGARGHIDFSIINLTPGTEYTISVGNSSSTMSLEFTTKEDQSALFENHSITEIYVSRIKVEFDFFRRNGTRITTYTINDGNGNLPERIFNSGLDGHQILWIDGLTRNTNYTVTLTNETQVWQQAFKTPEFPSQVSSITSENVLDNSATIAYDYQKNDSPGIVYYRLNSNAPIDQGWIILPDQPTNPSGINRFVLENLTQKTNYKVDLKTDYDSNIITTTFTTPNRVAEINSFQLTSWEGEDNTIANFQHNWKSGTVQSTLQYKLYQKNENGIFIQFKDWENLIVQNPEIEEIKSFKIDFATLLPLNVKKDYKIELRTIESGTQLVGSIDSLEFSFGVDVLETSNGGFPMWTIGLLIGLLILALIAYYFYRRYKKNKNTLEKNISFENPSTEINNINESSGIDKVS